jgi:hypothetical protein
MIYGYVKVRAKGREGERIPCLVKWVNARLCSTTMVVQTYESTFHLHITSACRLKQLHLRFIQHLEPYCDLILTPNHIPSPLPSMYFRSSTSSCYSRSLYYRMSSCPLISIEMFSFCILIVIHGRPLSIAACSKSLRNITTHHNLTIFIIPTRRPRG